MDFIEEAVVNLDASVSNIKLDNFNDTVNDYDSRSSVSTTSPISSKSVVATPNGINEAVKLDGNDKNKIKDGDGPRYQKTSMVLTKEVADRRSSIGDLFTGTVDAITGMPIQGMKTYIHLREHYDGPFLDGLRHGDGAVCTFLDGSGKYIGSYFQDYRRKGTLMTEKLTYTGTFKNDVFHGQGMLAKGNGTVYNGSFENGLMHGKGKLVEKDSKCEYDGQFLYGKKDGNGILLYSNGYSYKGQWKEDEKCGKGLEVLPSGERYEGEFQNDKRHGEGHLTTTSRVTKRGTWHNGNPIDGKWIFIYENGTMYEGNTKSLRPFGHGIMTYFDQNGQNLVATYEGEFVNCLRHGYGMCKFESDGQEHWGDWIADEPLQLLSDELKVEDVSIEEDLVSNPVPDSNQKSPLLQDSQCQRIDSIKDDKLSSKDIPNYQDPDNLPNQLIEQKVEHKTHHYVNGDTYHGLLDESNQREGSGTYISKRLQIKCVCEWSKSKRIGKGSIFFPSGSIYEGEFHNNVMEGSGKLQMVDGSVYIGEFKNGLFNGSGTLDDKICNSYFKGSFVDGLKHGKGEELSQNGIRYIGEYKRGVRSGEGILSKTNGEEEDQLIYQGQWSEDQMHGEGERVYELGRYKGKFVRNQRKGRGIYLFDNGSAMDGKWEDNKPSDGDWVINYSDETTFYGMAKNCKEPIFPDGSVKSLSVPHGFGTSKNSDGVLYSGYFVKGKKHGTGICVFPDGGKWDGRWENDIFTRNGKSCPSF